MPPNKMSKDKKQQIMLGVLVGVAAIIAIFVLTGNGGGEDEPPKDTVADTPPNTGGGPPTGSDPAPAGAGAPGEEEGSGSKVDLPPPMQFDPNQKHVEPNWEGDPDDDFDPFLVKRPEINRPEEQDQIQKLKDDWVLDGITKIGVKWKVFFVDQVGAYGQGDRLTGTYYTIRKIIFTPEKAAIVVVGDGGGNFEIILRKPSRYNTAKRK